MSCHNEYSLVWCHHKAEREVNGVMIIDIIPISMKSNFEGKEICYLPV